MATSASITAELQQQIGNDHGDLVRLAYNEMDVRNDVTYFPDVKNETRITTMRINKIVKPFSSTFSPTVGAVEFSPRTVGVKVAKADLDFNPEEYRQTYLAQFQMPGVGRSPEDLPFSKYIMEELFKQFGQEMNDDTAYGGIYNPTGTDAKDVANGYGKILADLILAGDVVPNAVGALSATNAYDQLTALYRSIPQKWRRKTTGLVAYMSENSYLAYQDSLDKKGFNTGRGEQQLGDKFLRGTNQLLELKPVSWMANSNRILITPKSNILLLADAIDQDLAKANIVPRVWGYDMGIACAIGFDFAYGKLIWCNEVA